MKKISSNEVELNFYGDKPYTKTVIISPITRAIRKKVNIAIFGWKEIKQGEAISMNIENNRKWQDILIKEVTWLTQNEIDELVDIDFTELETYINEINNPLTTTAWQDWSSDKVKKSKLSWGADGVWVDVWNEAN